MPSHWYEPRNGFGNSASVAAREASVRVARAAAGPCGRAAGVWALPGTCPVVALGGEAPFWRTLPAFTLPASVGAGVRTCRLSVGLTVGPGFAADAPGTLGFVTLVAPGKWAVKADETSMRAIALIGHGLERRANQEEQLDINEDAERNVEII